MSTQTIDALVRMLSERDGQFREALLEREAAWSRVSVLEQAKRTDLDLHEALEVIDWAQGNRIYKIKALRRITQIDLKAARDAIKSRFYHED